MTWADDIELSLVRGNSRYSFENVFGRLRAGEAYFCACGTLTASVCMENGLPTTMHVAGKWNDRDAEWLFAKCLDWAKDRGFDRIEIEGRPGWARFLKMKGWGTCQ